MSYNVPIRREQGGSVLTIGAGGSVNFEAGAKMGGTYSIGAGSTIYDAGTLTTFQAGASVTFNTTVSGTAIRFDVGGSTPSVGAGVNVPTHVAPMGSIYLRCAGSMSGLFVQIGADAAGSTWRGFQQGSAIG